MRVSVSDELKPRVAFNLDIGANAKTRKPRLGENEETEGGTRLADAGGANLPDQSAPFSSDLGGWTDHVARRLAGATGSPRSGHSESLCVTVQTFGGWRCQPLSRPQADPPGTAGGGGAGGAPLFQLYLTRRAPGLPSGERRPVKAKAHGTFPRGPCRVAGRRMCGACLCRAVPGV